MTTDLATTNGALPRLANPDPTLTPEVIELMLREAQTYVDSGLLPTSIKTAAAAFLVMKAGRELGIPATYALRNIHIIQNRPTCSAELMLSLVHQRYGPSRILVKQSTDERCVVLCRPVGWDITTETVWTLEDARRAKLDQKETWKQYPRAMLRSRAVSEACRSHFPAAIAGMYTPEEIGAAVAVQDDGTVTIIEGQAREVPFAGAVGARAGASDGNGAKPAPARTATRRELFDRFGRLCQQAVELGVEHGELTGDESEDEVAAAIAELVGRVNAELGRRKTGQRG